MRIFHVPLRFLRASPGSMVLTLVALLAAVVLVGATDIVNRAVLRAFGEIVDGMAGRASLQVRAGEGAFFPENVADRIAAVPGVELAVPLVVATGFVGDDSGELLTVFGVDVANDAAVRVYEARGAAGSAIEDPLVFLNTPDAVLVARVFAAHRGLAVEDRLALDTPKGRRTMTVKGLLEPQGVARVYGGNLLVMDLFAAETAFGQPGLINRVDVVVRPVEDIATVERAVAEALPPGLRVEMPARRKLDVEGIIRSTQVVLQSAALSAVLAAFLIAFSRLSSAFEMRTWQLGVLRSLGVRRQTLAWDLVKEALLLGCAGVALGIPIAVTVARALLPLVATAAALNLKSATPRADLVLQPASLLLAAALGLGTPALAALLPARRVAARSLAEVTRIRGLEPPDAGGRLRTAGRVFVPLAVPAALAFEVLHRSAAWGLVATALTVVAGAMGARPLLRVAKGALAHGLLGAAARYAAAGCTQRPRRVALAAGTIAVGLGSIGWLATVACSFERSVVGAAVGLVRGDIVVTSSHATGGFVEAPVSDVLLDDLSTISGVHAVVGLRWLDWPFRDRTITISAVDPDYFESGAFGSWPIVGTRTPDAWMALRTGVGAIASSNFLANFGVRVGDPIVLEAPAGPVHLRVVASYVNFASPSGTLEMARPAFAQLWRDHDVTRVAVAVDPGEDREVVRRRIAAELGRKWGLRVLSARELIEYFASQVHRAFGIIPVVAALILFVVLVGVADALGAGVLERRRELASLRALGLRRATVRTIVLWEAGIAGGLGILLAGALTMLLGLLWVHVTFPKLFGWTLDLHPPYASAGGVALATLAVCLLAGAVPATRAARVVAAVALRDE